MDEKRVKKQHQNRRFGLRRQRKVNFLRISGKDTFFTIIMPTLFLYRKL
jgi:hypothetical protein